MGFSIFFLSIYEFQVSCYYLYCSELNKEFRDNLEQAIIRTEDQKATQYARKKSCALKGPLGI